LGDSPTAIFSEATLPGITSRSEVILFYQPTTPSVSRSVNPTL